MPRDRDIPEPFRLVALAALAAWFAAVQPVRVGVAPSTGAPPASAPASGTYEPRYRTIAHEFLDLEAEVSPVPDSCYRVLDGVIADAAAKITTRRPYTQREALAALRTIDEVLTAHNFVCSIPGFRVDTLSAGLTARPLDPRVPQQGQNAARADHIRRHAGESFHHVDCDIGCFVYLGVAEAIGLPISFVEAGEHTFVRWRFPDKTHLNWDTNYGAARFSDKDYQVRGKFPPALVTRGVYLRDLSRQEATGYFLSLRGNALRDSGQYARAIEDHKKAAALHPSSPMVWNNLAWAYATAPGPDYKDRGRQALPHALRAVEIHRAPAFLDTLACAYAETGDFDQAVKIEQEALRREAKAYFREMIEVFRLGRTYLQHAARMRQALDAIRAAGRDGLTRRQLAESLTVPAQELDVALGGLQREGKAVAVPQPGHTVFRAP